MEKLSNLISKKLFSFYEGAFIGVILNVAFDEKFNIASLIVADSEGENEYAVVYDKTSVADGNVFVTSVGELLTAGASAPRIIGKSVFTNKGQFCGRVEDVYLSKKAAVCFATESMSFLPSQIGACGDVIILGKVAKGEAVNSFFAQHDEQKVFALASESVKEEPSVPYRVSTDAKSLIGKMATKDIFGLNNEILLKKYEIITQKKLLEIKKHNKLNILFYNCK